MLLVQMMVIVVRLLLLVMIPVERVHHGDGGFEILHVYIDYGLCGLSHFSTARRGTFVCNLLYTVGRRASGGGGSVVVGCTRLGHRAHARRHVLDMLYYTYYNIMAKMYLFIFVLGGRGFWDGFWSSSLYHARTGTRKKLILWSKPETRAQ